MFRQLALPVLLAVLLVPDWSGAYCPPVPCGPPPVVYGPVPCPPLFAPPVVYGPSVMMTAAADCPPAAATVEPRTPTIVPERMKEQPKADPKKEVRNDPPAPPKEFATPTPAEPKVEPAAATTSIPSPPPTGAGEKIPPLPVPMNTKLPPLEFPPSTETNKPLGTLPSLDLPKAEAPKTDDKGKPTPLPKFDFAIPKAEESVEANKPTVAKASPLSAERVAVVDVYPVDGPAPTTPKAKRAVGFINKSSRDVLLTIDGQLVTLPAKNVLRAELPAAFQWQIGGEKPRQMAVPDTAPGVDVVIRN